MTLALSLGRRGLGRVWPNPAVGCVIVQNGRIIGRGRTADGGRPHAEVVALRQAGDAAKGATAYVTLEPCAHHGQTPPCAQALISAGISRCVIATGDPDPRVSGKGIEMLQAAKIIVETGVLKDQADADHAGFFNRETKGRPFLTLKLATTLDGRIATASGDSQWITGPQARRKVHAMRASHDAVMVGAGTVRADNPSLNVRGMGAVPQPVRVVVSRALDLPLDSVLGNSANDQPVWLCHAAGAPVGVWQDRGANTLLCDESGNTLDLISVMQSLAGRGITRVFCEGGGRLAAALIKAGLVDELVIFHGGVLTGADGLPAVAPLGLSVLSDAPRFTLIETQSIGGDTLQRWRPA